MDSTERPNDETIKFIFNRERIMDEATAMQKEKRETITTTIDTLYYQNKYSYFYKNFHDAFEMILDDPDNHDSLAMLKRMLVVAELYHTNKLTHESASKVAGEVLFKKFYTDKKTAADKEKKNKRK